MVLNLKGLSSKAVTGAFFKMLEERTASSWMPLVATQFQGTQETEKYTFLTDVPGMQVWNGQRGMTTHKRIEFSVTGTKYQTTTEFDADDFRRDKTSQILARIAELASRAAQLPQTLISALINANSAAYDGTAFFADSGHVNANGDTIDNIVTQAAATGTSPTEAEAATGILAAIAQMLAFKDDAGQPRNEMMQRAVVMTPPFAWGAVVGAIKNLFVAAGQSNTLLATGLSLIPVMNPRLTATDKIYVFRADSDVKPFGFTEWETAAGFGPELASLEEESDWYFQRDSMLYGVKRICTAFFGRFDQACQCTFT